MCGSVPVVTLGWGASQKTYTPAYGQWNANQIVIPINCSDFSPAGSYRLLVSTGQGMPCRDGVSFHFNLRGPNGASFLRRNGFSSAGWKCSRPRWWSCRTSLARRAKAIRAVLS